MIPCGACGSYALSRSSQRHSQQAGLNLLHDRMASTKVLWAALVFGALAVAAVVALSITVGVYGKQILDFVEKHEADLHNPNSTTTASSLAATTTTTKSTRIVDVNTTASSSSSIARNLSHEGQNSGSSAHQNVMPVTSFGENLSTPLPLNPTNLPALSVTGVSSGVPVGYSGPPMSSQMSYGGNGQGVYDGGVAVSASEATNQQRSFNLQPGVPGDTSRENNVHLERSDVSSNEIPSGTRRHRRPSDNAVQYQYDEFTERAP